MEIKYFTIDVCKSMHAIYDMYDPNTGAHDPNTRYYVGQNYVHSLECKNNVLCQQLLHLSFKCFRIGTSGAKASDIVPLVDDPTRGQESIA